MHAVALLPNAQLPCAPTPSPTPPLALTDAETGMRRLAGYLAALGRYGTTAFIVPRYGHGEFSQAFTRACAVSDGIYMLRVPPLAYKLNEIQEEGEGLVEMRTRDGLTLKAKHVVSSEAYLPDLGGGAESIADVAYVLGGAVCIVNEPISARSLTLFSSTPGSYAEATRESTTSAPASSSSGDISLLSLVIPPHCQPLNNPTAIYVLQQSAANHMSCGSLCVINVWTSIPATDTEAPLAIPQWRESAVTMVQRVLDLLLPPRSTDGGSTGVPAAVSVATGGSGHATPSCTRLWSQCFSVAVAKPTPLSAIPPHWTVMRAHPTGGPRLTNEHDALEALEAFSRIAPGQEFFGGTQPQPNSEHSEDTASTESEDPAASTGPSGGDASASTTGLTPTTVAVAVVCNDATPCVAPLETQREVESGSGGDDGDDFDAAAALAMLRAEED